MEIDQINQMFRAKVPADRAIPAAEQLSLPVDNQPKVVPEPDGLPANRVSSDSAPGHLCVVGTEGRPSSCTQSGRPLVTRRGLGRCMWLAKGQWGRGLSLPMLVPLSLSRACLYSVAPRARGRAALFRLQGRPLQRECDMSDPPSCSAHMAGGIPNTHDGEDGVVPHGEGEK